MPCVLQWCVTHSNVLRMDPDVEPVLAGHLQELRRGTVVLAVLAELEEPEYGYGLLQTLAAAGFGVDANTLYPLLRRLEKQGLLSSEWDTDEPRPRKFYRVAAPGRVLRDALLAEWRELDSAVRGLAAGSPAGATTTPDTRPTGPEDGTP